MGLTGRYLIALCIAAFYFNGVSPASTSNFECSEEEHRPRYHFSPKENWMNDPNGMIYYDGFYHLYYQYHDNGTEWGPMSWGHAISRDLNSWDELPVAMEPNNLGMIFSGSAVVDTTNTTGFMPEDGPDPLVAIYTSAAGEDHSLQRQSIAYSLDGGLTFNQYEGNPVLNSTDTSDFRDPKVFYHDNRWIMSLAVKDKVEFYSSTDLKEWELQSEFGKDPAAGSHAGVWECPDLIPLLVSISDKLTIELWVLLLSINPGGPNGGSATQYFIGQFTSNNTNNIRFNAFPWSPNQWLDWGPDNYAGVTFSNEPKARQIYIGWMSNWLYAGSTPNKVHRGQMTIPRQLGIRVLNHTASEYRLTSNPISDLTKLRHPLQSLEHSEPFAIFSQQRFHLTEGAAFSTPLMELEIDLEMEHNPQFSICSYNDVEEEVCFGFNSTHWFLDRSKSGDTEFDENFNKTLLAYAPREISDTSTNIRIFLDVSSIEVFADGGLTTMTALHFPTKPFDKFYIHHESRLSTVNVNNFKVWGLQCWFEASEAESGSGIASLNFSVVVLINLSFALRHYLGL